MEDMTTDDLFQDDVVEIAVDNNVPTDNDADVAVDTEEEVQPVDDVDDTDVAPTDTEEEKDIDAVELSGVERYLSDYGIVAGRITFEDGENVDFDALDPEEQYTILQSLTTESRPTIEDEYDLDTTEIDLLNDIRNSGVSVEEYMNSTINQHVQQTMAVR
ncbi:MAG: hypothetical protein KAH32_07775, partial [Chlamydiia bacterium]|nr:hypothetical protein [Chlamydiia bacterium]